MSEQSRCKKCRHAWKHHTGITSYGTGIYMSCRFETDRYEVCTCRKFVPEKTKVCSVCHKPAEPYRTHDDRLVWEKQCECTETKPVPASLVYDG